MFILLELSRPILEDRIVITGDKTLAHRYAQTRWKDLSRVAATTSNPDWNRFLIFSNHPANASSVTNEKLLKELSEASDIFGKAALSVSMFEEKYIFMMIPYFEDMFEASKFQEAITTRESAHMRRAEIDKLMEVIDVFDVYANKDNVEAAFDDASKPARAG